MSAQNQCIGAISAGMEIVMKNTEILSDDIFYYQKVSKAAKKNPCTRHYHNTLEIYYLKDGSCNYFIDKKIYELKKGDVVIIPDGIIHKTNYTKPYHSRTLINCRPDYMPKSVMPYIESFIYIYRNPDIIEEIEAILDKIGAEYESNSPFREDALRCYTNELFFLIAKNANKKEMQTAGSIFVEETVKYIQENYMNKITLADIAKMRSVSEEHLSRTFKKETGFGFSEYVTLLRLQKAESMLKNEPGKSICEIAYSCGFNDSNYFSDRFKKTYGISPSQMKPKISIVNK